MGALLSRYAAKPSIPTPVWGLALSSVSLYLFLDKICSTHRGSAFGRTGKGLRLLMHFSASSGNDLPARFVFSSSLRTSSCTSFGLFMMCASSLMPSLYTALRRMPFLPLIWPFLDLPCLPALSATVVLSILNMAALTPPSPPSLLASSSSCISLSPLFRLAVSSASMVMAACRVAICIMFLRLSAGLHIPSVAALRSSVILQIRLPVGLLLSPQYHWCVAGFSFSAILILSQ